MCRKSHYNVTLHIQQKHGRLLLSKCHPIGHRTAHSFFFCWCCEKYPFYFILEVTGDLFFSVASAFVFDFCLSYAAAVVLNFLVCQDFAAEVISIEGLDTDEYELVCIRNIDVLAKW